MTVKQTNRLLRERETLARVGLSRTRVLEMIEAKQFNT